LIGSFIYGREDEIKLDSLEQLCASFGLAVIRILNLHPISAVESPQAAGEADGAEVWGAALADTILT
jgi:hypothetical protein